MNLRPPPDPTTFPSSGPRRVARARSSLLRPSPCSPCCQIACFLRERVPPEALPRPARASPTERYGRDRRCFRIDRARADGARAERFTGTSRQIIPLVGRRCDELRPLLGFVSTTSTYRGAFRETPRAALLPRSPPRVPWVAGARTPRYARRGDRSSARAARRPRYVRRQGA